jgi:hypothetical protein
MDPALALRWGAIAAERGTVLPMAWKPALLAMLLPFADHTAADGTCLELRGTIEGRRWAVAMTLPLADGRPGLAGKGAA